MSAEQRRRAHQLELFEIKQAEGKKRYAADGDAENKDVEVVFKKFESYKKETQIPNETKDLRVLVDRRNATVLLPIYGIAVPFHLNTIKNVSKTDDRDHSYLRFNFITPGQAGKKDPNSLQFEDPNATFIRALSFKSSDTHRFAEIFKEINDLKKDLAKKETERLQMSDLVTQDKLVEIRGKRPTRLTDIFVRPALEGKKYPGEVEIHTNGLRYVSQVRSDQKIGIFIFNKDVLFSNVQNFFFQPCNHEMVVLIHIHLKNPIMVGKKKTKDIQFYREVVDSNFDETGNRKRRHNYGDEDELMAEQEERKRRSALNREFKEFAVKATEMVRLY